MLERVEQLQYVELSEDALTDGTATSDGGKPEDEYVLHTKLASPWPVRDGTAASYPLKGVSAVRNLKPRLREVGSARWSGADIIWLTEALQARLVTAAGGRGTRSVTRIGGDPESGAMRIRAFVLQTLEGISSAGPLPWMRHVSGDFTGWLKEESMASLPSVTVVHVHGSGHVENVQPMGREGLVSALGSLALGEGVTPGLHERIGRCFDDSDADPGSGWARLSKYVKRDWLSPDTLFGYHLVKDQVEQDSKRVFRPNATSQPLASVHSDMESCRVCAIVPDSVCLDPDSSPENEITIEREAPGEYDIESVPGSGSRNGSSSCTGGCSPCVEGSYSGSLSPGGFVAKEHKHQIWDGEGEDETNPHQTQTSDVGSISVWNGSQAGLKELASAFCSGGWGSSDRVVKRRASSTIRGARGVAGTQLASFSSHSWQNQLIAAGGIIPADGSLDERCETGSGGLILKLHPESAQGFPVELDIKKVKVLAVLGHVKVSRDQSADSVANRPSVGSGDGSADGGYSVVSSGGPGAETCTCGGGGGGGASGDGDCLQPVYADDNDPESIIGYTNVCIPEGDSVCGTAGTSSDLIEAYPSMKERSIELSASEARSLDARVYVAVLDGVSYDKANEWVKVSDIRSALEGAPGTGTGGVNVSSAFSEPAAFRGCESASGGTGSKLMLGRVTYEASLEETTLLAVGPVMVEVEFKNTGLKS